MLHWLPHVLIVAILLAAFVAAYRVREDDSAWVVASPYVLLGAIRIPLGVALIAAGLVAAGLVADSILFLVFGVIFFLVGLWAMRGSLRVARAERETISRDRSF